MSGHSKWSTIKRKKGKTDAARSRVFTRLIREINVAARDGGGDLDTNPRLRTAVTTAKGANMPADNIKKAILRGTGELPGVVYEEVIYEAYGPGGVAILLRSLTDNRNRTVAELRHMLGRFGGNLGETGSVNWIFQRSGLIEVDASSADEDLVMEVALEAGASDMTNDGDSFSITSEVAAFESVKSALEAKGITTKNAEMTMIPQTSVQLSGRQAITMLKLMDTLEDYEDVQNVYANFDIDDEVIEQFDSEN